MRLRILLIAALFYPFALAAQDQDRYLKLRDDTSDWWSVGNQNFHMPDLKPLDKDIPADNLAVAGLALDFDDRDSLQAAYRKFGNATIVERGDAAGRDQVCYVSSQDRNIHLIFEAGELELVFYVFASGRHWNGEDLCTKSRDVTEALRTDSGLGLGITPADLQRILGKPDFSDGTKFVYWRGVKKTLSAAELAKIRESYPDISKREFEDFEKNHNSYLLGIYIEARFTNSHLNYLVILKGRGDPGEN